MDYRNILATGFLLLCGSVFVHSLNSANAFPRGVNSSLGSNPKVSFYDANTNSSPIGLEPTQDFIMTTLISNSNSCIPSVNGIQVYPITGSDNPFYYNYNNNNKSFFLEGNGNLHVPAGQSLLLTNCSTFYLEGYYVHP